MKAFWLRVWDRFGANVFTWYYVGQVLIWTGIVFILESVGGASYVMHLIYEARYFCIGVILIYIGRRLLSYKGNKRKVGRKQANWNVT